MTDKHILDESDCLIVSSRPDPPEKIKSHIKKIAQLDLTIKQLLVQNPLEKLVPFNLWFHHPAYKIIDYFENNQHIRTRSYDKILLTPVVRFDNPSMAPLNKFHTELSLYQPFYPETFYTMYDFLFRGHIYPQHVLHIGRENKLGSLEALMFYTEKNDLNPNLNPNLNPSVYHAWLAGGELYDLCTSEYKILSPRINYLSQAYKLTHIKSTTELITYDFIHIDPHHTFESIVNWAEHELDLHSMLFYFLKCTLCLKPKGSMLIKLNLIGNISWIYLFQIAEPFFSEYEFFRSDVIHPFNSEIYLYLNGFVPDSERTHSSLNLFFMNMYKSKMHKTFFLNVNKKTVLELKSSNNICIKYYEALNQWFGLVSKTVDQIQNSVVPDTKHQCAKWLKRVGLKPIGSVSMSISMSAPVLAPTPTPTDADFELKPKLLLTSEIIQLDLILQTDPSSKPKIKISSAHSLFKNKNYITLLEHRAELNSHKRVMDTKPSRIFTDNKYKSSQFSKLLTWEELSYTVCPYGKIKRILEKEYQIEMATNAWIKLFEILTHVSDIFDQKKNLKTFHICEAPGAFISATNYFVNEHTKIKNWTWYAQTLRTAGSADPFGKNISDKYKLIQAYPDNWLFGNKSDESGDITHSAVLKSYVANPLLSGIEFMTADAGIYLDPTELNNQEIHIAKIIMGQVICILGCLSTNGSAILKTFLPMTEPLTISMIYLLTSVFETVCLIKPPASHDCNSEIYVVLKNYTRVKKSVLNLLYDLLDNPALTSKTLLFERIDPNFLKLYTSHITCLINRQIQALCKNYYFYNNYDKIKTIQSTTRDYVRQWLAKYVPRSQKTKLLEN